MQLAGRPFDDATVLRAAHAYEQATGWRNRRPVLKPNMPRVDVVPPPAVSGAPVEQSVREWVEAQSQRCGLIWTRSSSRCLPKSHLTRVRWRNVYAAGLTAASSRHVFRFARVAAVVLERTEPRGC